MGAFLLQLGSAGFRQPTDGRGALGAFSVQRSAFRGMATSSARSIKVALVPPTTTIPLKLAQSCALHFTLHTVLCRIPPLAHSPSLSHSLAIIMFSKTFLAAGGALALAQGAFAAIGTASEFDVVRTHSLLLSLPKVRESFSDPGRDPKPSLFSNRPTLSSSTRAPVSFRTRSKWTGSTSRAPCL